MIRSQSDTSKIVTPFGYVGWVGKLGLLWKMYVSNISNEGVEDHYMAFFWKLYPEKFEFVS